MAEVGLIEVAGGRGVVVDRRVVEPRPAAVRPLGRVGDQDVGMELRVAVSRGAVDIGGGEVAVARDELRAASSPAGPARLALHIGKGGADGFSVGGLDLCRRLSSPEAPEQRDRLGSREGEIEAGDRAVGRHPAHPHEQLAVDRVSASEHRDELILADLPVETEASGGVADPLARLLALAGVVVLGAFGHLVEVVALLPFAEHVYARRSNSPVT